MFDSHELEIIGKALRYYEQYGISNELIADSVEFVSDVTLSGINEKTADILNQKRYDLREKLESRLDEITLLKAKVINLKSKSIADDVESALIDKE